MGNEGTLAHELFAYFPFTKETLWNMVSSQVYTTIPQQATILQIAKIRINQQEYPEKRQDYPVVKQRQQEGHSKI